MTKSEMRSKKTGLAGSILSICVFLFVGMARLSSAQQIASQNEGPSGDLQRAYQMDQYTELAKSGPERGENIYFYKCFYCHNHYAKGGPALENLFKHPQLYSGDPVNDQTVAALIKNGSSGMPGFGYSLSDGDLEDLISYFRSEACCYEADNPPANPQYRAVTQKWPVPSGLRGGARGLVRASNGEVLEGIKVQLIAPNGMRTTVFSNEEGKYEFPLMQAGAYVLRIATPGSFKPYQRDGVQINGTNGIGEIVLEKVPEVGGERALPGALPPTPEIAAQLSGAEILWNLSGTDQEKSTFVKTCGVGCHDLKEILRNRFDERSWRVMVSWMTSSTSIFVVRRDTSKLSPEAEMVLKWLVRVRGPESKDQPYRMFPRPSGSSTRVIITEYEMPRRFLSMHGVYGDSKGNIWYDSHRTPYVGILDPRTGIVKEYKVPMIPGVFPGQFHVVVDKNDIGWYSENWSNNLMRLDPRTGVFKRTPIESKDPVNPSGFITFGLAPDGSVWSVHDQEIVKIDPATGKIVKTYSPTKNPLPNDNLVSTDGRFWAGSARPDFGGNTGMILDIRSGKMYETNTGDLPSSGARGEFDRDDNAWFGGHMGQFVEIINEIDKGKGIHMRVFWPPTPYFPYSQFYMVVPDKNGEVWGALVHGRGFVRFNPKTERWQVYDNAEPSAFSRHAWIDNSTSPVTIWYPDYQMGTLVRIQPLG
jgi:streptogramin lyase/mono/diheme cytochrome c family protein